MRNDEVLKKVESMTTAQLMGIDKDTRNQYIIAYVLAKRATVRATAKKFGISKSTVWKVCHNYMKCGNAEVIKQLRSIFDRHIETRHIQGGMSTKRRWDMINMGQTPPYHQKN